MLARSPVSGANVALPPQLCLDGAAAPAVRLRFMAWVFEDRPARARGAVLGPPQGETWQALRRRGAQVASGAGPLDNGPVPASIIRVNGVVEVQRCPTVSLRCPSCRQMGTFDPLGRDLQSISDDSILGQRKCPNPRCEAHVFVIIQGRAVRSYPPELIDFDSTDVPPAVTAALEEAIACHASGCFRASAMMVRRTLEALCADRGAVGGDLKARIADLGSKIVLPSELLAGLDDLRLLGNDAAHIEARDYDAVNSNEVTVALEFAKEVLKAAYQYASLLKRLRDVRTPAD